MLLNIAVKPIWLLMENAVQNEVGHDAWGLYSALLAFGFLFVTLADLGINQYTTKRLASEPDLLQSYFPNLLSFKLLLLFAYPLVMMGLGTLIGYQGMELWMLLVISFLQAGIQLLMFFRANFQAFQAFKTDGAISVSERVLLILGIGGLLLVGSVSLNVFIFSRIIAIFLSVAGCFFLMRRIHGKMQLQLDFSLISKILQKSWPFAVITIVYSVHDKVDQVMLERLYSKHEAGLYSGAYRWLDGFSSYLWIVLPIFFAKFAHHIHQTKELEDLFSFGQVVVALPLLFVSGVACAYPEKLLFLFSNSTPEELAVMADCVQVLFLVGMVNAIFAIFSTILTATNHERFVNWVVFGGIIVNIVLNAILIPKYGAIASAWTTLVTYALMSIVYVVYMQLRLAVRIPYLQILILFGITALMMWSFFYFQAFGWHWLLVSAISALPLVVFGLWVLWKRRVFARG